MIYLLRVNIMNKCDGCGSILQTSDQLGQGYTKIISKNLCERCFRIRNYNDYKIINKDNKEYFEVLKKINATNDLVILVVDLFNINKDLNIIKKYLNNDILLVLTKRDLLPKLIYNERLLEYMTSYNLNEVDKIIISSKNNFNLDLLMDKVNNFKKTKNVYIIGFTNAGKSSLINKIIYNYSNLKKEITTSNLPSTTLDTIEININENLTLIDTPGILDEGNIINCIDLKLLKKIIPQIAIKPITYQVKKRAIFIIDELLRLDIENNNITFYLSTELEINRYYNETSKLLELKKHMFSIDAKTDIVITGLGFIKVMSSACITLYTIKGVSVYTRKSLI